eukprot:13467571-Alexandrium_andersonii.AAC.1
MSRLENNGRVVHVLGPRNRVPQGAPGPSAYSQGFPKHWWVKHNQLIVFRDYLLALWLTQEGVLQGPAEHLRPA